MRIVVAWLEFFVLYILSPVSVGRGVRLRRFCRTGGDLHSDYRASVQSAGYRNTGR